MRLLKVAAAALNQTPLAWAVNQGNIVAAIRSARAAGVGILCLPELCITGYGCEDAFLAPFVRETALDLLTEVLPETRGMVVSFGLPLQHAKAVFNACALAADGRLLGFVAKRSLAGDGIHYEPRWFKPWPAGTRTHVEVRGEELPLGDYVFEVGGVRIGFEICEDAWAAKRPGAELSLDAVDVILNPSASHFAFGKHEVRKRLVLEGSRAFGVAYVYSNLLGNEAGRAIYDGDALIAAGGALVGKAPRFSLRSVELATAVVDLDLGDVRQGALSSYQPNLSDVADARVKVPFNYPPATSPSRPLEESGWEKGPYAKEEELTRALTLGLFDYLRKTSSRGFVVSLSGGADSALVACLVAMMARLALAALGADGLVERLPFLPPECPATPEALVGRLLTTAYQATAHSSETTRRAAREVATALGARHLELDVEELVRGYRNRIEAALGSTFDWEQHDTALQNIQARVRAPSVWLIANVERALLLATSNRSEAAVGYATMDGDTAGGLSPIAGVDKNFVRSYLRWLEREGPVGLGPIPALRAVNEQAPTAELRPPSAEQTDERDLMPYDVLDAIERAAIRDKRSPREILGQLGVEFPAHARATLVVWVRRFFRLFAQNQWKRERYAPSFHVDDESLDPKTWYRFPILSGGFERELAELDRDD
ncbi:MAG TPA: NAD(+) synthase [Polyangiaceae bacterium]|nr:NAD(+) synthase [Polyangiaceae bacterium]